MIPLGPWAHCKEGFPGTLLYSTESPKARELTPDSLPEEIVLPLEQSIGLKPLHKTYSLSLVSVEGSSGQVPGHRATSGHF